MEHLKHDFDWLERHLSLSFDWAAQIRNIVDQYICDFTILAATQIIKQEFMWICYWTLNWGNEINETMISKPQPRGWVDLPIQYTFASFLFGSSCFDA